MIYYNVWWPGVHGHGEVLCDKNGALKFGRKREAQAEAQRYPGGVVLKNQAKRRFYAAQA